ncbi:protein DETOXIFICATION 14 [Sesamum alatum]|uniref:Protein DETOXIFICATION n=1 Tax=Sesamum alatum TaxID=300844 RepID=A0AAE1YAU4_9LAMI|nr:protein DETOXIFICATION 14 [Sesamum alatum]
MGSPDQPAQTLWQPWWLLFPSRTYFSRQKYKHVGETDGQSGVVSDQQEFVRELKRVNRIAWPMIVVSISQSVSRLFPIFMLGHLDELSLSSASIGTSFCNATGFSVISGMADALETLCGQAYGARQYRQVGTFTYAGILGLFLVCLPVSILWIYTGKLLIFLGQDPLVSKEAGKYVVWLIPTLFPYAVLHSLIRYLQSQSLILPMLWISLASLFINLPICWAFVFKLNLGSVGAALSICLSYWLNVLLLGLYVKYSSACKRTHAPFSKEVLFGLQQFFQLGVPSASMVCLEWWSFEIVIFFSGLLSNPQLEMSVLSICLTFSSLHFQVPYSFGIAASTRISNELGAGNPQAARLILCIVLILSISEFVLAATTIFICRRVLGYAFSEDKSVVGYIQEMTPFLCLSIIVDSLQAILSGVARGSGWQRIGAYVNLGAYYLVGIPMALLMGFALHFKGKGLWIGTIVGAAVQCFLLSIVTSLIDWEKQTLLGRGGGRSASVVAEAADGRRQRRRQRQRIVCVSGGKGGRRWVSTVEVEADGRTVGVEVEAEAEGGGGTGGGMVGVEAQGEAADGGRRRRERRRTVDRF